MSTLYPNSLDAFINPTAGDFLSSITVPHADQHANINDAVEAIETVLGINPSGSHATVKDRIIAIEQILSQRGTIFMQDADAVDITGGSIVGLSNFDNIIINGGTF